MERDQNASGVDVERRERVRRHARVQADGRRGPSESTIELSAHVSEWNSACAARTLACSETTQADDDDSDAAPTDRSTSSRDVGAGAQGISVVLVVSLVLDFRNDRPPLDMPHPPRRTRVGPFGAGRGTGVGLSALNG